ncbi:MAG: hypothetical protein FWC92_07865 [Defluviitaleaceae bacterium]|nr:hypothetical protein [Defluviitaleaceae bacterium]
MKQKIIDFLLSNADPSIVLRVKKEVLNGITEKENDALLDKIISQKNVQLVTQAQKPDGWIGNAFHGSSPSEGAGMLDNMEVGLRFLAEKGLPPHNTVISKAVHAFLLDEPFHNECRTNAPADDYTVTALGLFHIRSSIIIRAGYEYMLPKNDYIDLKHDINHSLMTFANVLDYSNLDHVIDASKKKLSFKQGVCWPCSYDLRMLAHSHSWRANKNVSLLAAALNKLFSFEHDREKMVYTKVKSFYKAPCLAFIHNQIYCLGLMDENYVNFDLMELFARCGVVRQVDFLNSKYEYLLSLVNDDLTINYKTTSRERDWGPYGGFALEEDWKTKTRKQCDLLFRVLMIMHYAEGNTAKT